MGKKFVEECPDALGSILKVGDRVLFTLSAGGWRFGVGYVTGITWEWNSYREVDMFQVGIKTIYGQTTSKSNLGVVGAKTINDALLS